MDDQCDSIASMEWWRRSSWNDCEIARNDSRLLRCRTGRGVDDCANDCKDNKDISIVQMRMMIGRQSSRVILPRQTSNYDLTALSALSQRQRPREIRTIMFSTATSPHILQPLKEILIVHLAPLPPLSPRHNIESLSITPLGTRSVSAPLRAERIDRSERANRSRRRG